MHTHTHLGIMAHTSQGSLIYCGSPILLFYTGLGTFYPGHILWDSVQNKKVEHLVQNDHEFQGGDSRALNKCGTLSSRLPCVTKQLSGL